MGRQGEWDDDELERLRISLEERAERAVDSAWELIVSPPPNEQLRTDLLQDPDLVTPERIVEIVGEADPTDTTNLLNDDKLVCLSISSEPEGYVVRARELDLRMRYFGPQVEFLTPNRMLVHGLVFDALAKVFSPVIRIETSEPRKATARIRAGGLVLREDSPARVDESSILMPLIRRNERSGRPKQITLVDWTFLTVEKKEGSVLDCKIHTTWNNPLGGRSSMRIQKIALGIKPVHDHGALELVSQGEPSVPLEGYEILAKDPFVEDSEAVNLGATDWRGRLDVPRSDHLLRILYVTNGGENLVRLPMVPGYNLISRTEMPNDEVRLEAEAFIRGVQVELIDLVARREILAQRIRKRLQEAELDQAQLLLDEFRKLTTSTELLARMDSKFGGLSSNNRRTRAKSAPCSPARES